MTDAVATSICLLWPVNFTLAYVGCTVLEPFVHYGVEADLRYSASDAVEARLRAVADEFGAGLPQVDRRRALPFNRKADWGENGRSLPDAPAYSPFVRHRSDLDLG